ncbi:MAG: hypothetical protein OEW00_01010 [candidate division Zixibacteria bacterium]|nr:hypothetical protein [candidate division Zixibacteria bacterium]
MTGNRILYLFAGRVVALALLSALCLVAAAEGAAITSKAAAVEIASQYTGFAEAMPESHFSLEDRVHLVSLRDSTTPFTTLFTDGRAVWRVDFKSVQLVRNGSSEKNTQLLRDFEVYIDSATGNFVKAICRHRELDSYADTILPAHEVEVQLEQGREFFQVPEAIPVAPLAMSLLGSPHSPFSAKEIMAQYVLLSYLGHSARPVWMIWLRGIPPVDFNPPPGASADWIPIYQRNRLRQVVCAVTGRVLYTDTGPVVRTTPEDKKRIFGIDEDPPKSPDSTRDSGVEGQKAIATPAEALAAAVAYTGFSSEFPSNLLSDDDVKLVSLIDSTTPFLSKFRGGEKAWCITFRDVRLAEPKKGQSDSSLLRTFQVYIDSTTGRFLKAVCDYKALNPEKDLTITAAEAEQQIAAGGETYLEPPAFPPVSMGRALLGCPRDPFSAKQITIQYILMGKFWESPRLVWVITLRGIPPVTPKGPGDSVPVYMRNQVRQVVNAKTGHVIFISNAPGMGHAVKRLRGIGPGPD